MAAAIHTYVHNNVRVSEWCPKDEAAVLLCAISLTELATIFRAAFG